MDEKEFHEELEAIEEDVKRGISYSPCAYFHGREKIFTKEQFEIAKKHYIRCLEEKKRKKKR